MNKLVDKLWGDEEWLVNNESYCAKILRVLPGYQSSLHMHAIKKETFIIRHGAIVLEIGHTADSGSMAFEEMHMVTGDTYTILPGTFHRFWSDRPGGARILEVSTTHSDHDVVRLENSRAR